MPDRHEKTQAPTPRRRREAREKGQVAKSTDLSPAVVLLATVFFISFLPGFFYRNIVELIKTYFEAIANPTIGMDNMPSFFLMLISKYMIIMTPIFTFTMLAAIVTNYIQVGFLFTAHPIKPDINRINPVNGFKRIFSRKAFVELLKSFFKVIIVGYIAYLVVSKSYPMLLSMSDMDTTGVLFVIGSVVYELAVKVGLALLALAILDYIYQRFDFEQTLRMTRREVREEYKQQEGDPLLKSRIRQRQRQLAMRRMMEEVPTADVVITNPTHLAIVLKYDRSKMTAPKIVAKGERLIALKIKKIAEENFIPVIEDKPLAQALYKTGELGLEIPIELYQAVAEILALVYKLRNRIKGNLAYANI